MASEGPIAAFNDLYGRRPKSVALVMGLAFGAAYAATFDVWWVGAGVALAWFVLWGWVRPRLVAGGALR